MEQATLAGGCFWCIEHAFDDLPGVVKAVSGYAGGTKETANYYAVASRTTQHREAVQVTFDPEKISYKEILQQFWQQIDPTDEGGQFADRGFEYTTAIYYHSPEQQQIAEETKKDVAESGIFDKPIVTSVEPFTTFFEAEAEHQGYAKRCPLRYKMYRRGSGRASFIDEVWGKNKGKLKK